jgi:hypothetical protein
MDDMGTYTAHVTDAATCDVEATADLIIGDYPTVDMASCQPACEGTTASCTAMVSGGTPPYLVEWLSPGGEVVASCELAGPGPCVIGLDNITLDDAGTYTARVFDDLLCSNEAQTDLLVAEAPSVTPGTCDALCEGLPAGCTVTVGGGLAPYLVEWIGPGGGVVSTCDLTAPGTCTLDIDSVTTDDAGTYTIRVYDKGGCEATTQLDFVVDDAPDIDSVMCDPVCIGDPATCMAMISGGSPPYTISWLAPNGATIATCALPVPGFCPLNLGRAQPDDAGVYTVLVTDTSDCMTEMEVELIVEECEICGPDSGSCFQPHGTPGCDDPGCCDAVCSMILECCTVAWDELCVETAFEVCPNGQQMPPRGSWSNPDTWSAGEVPDGESSIVIRERIALDIPNARSRKVVVRDLGHIEVGDVAAALVVDEITLERGGRTTMREGVIFAADAAFIGFDGHASLAIQDDAVFATPELYIGYLGHLTGNGTIEATVFNSGGIDPGPGVNTLVIDGDLIQTPDGLVAAELGFEGSDTLVVTGEAHLAGALVVWLEDDYRPMAGDRFVVVTHETRFGRFTEHDLPDLVEGLELHVEYGVDRVIIEVVESAPVADDEDQVEDVDDAVIVEVGRASRTRAP